MALNTLRELLIDQTARLYDGENQIANEIPVVAGLAHDRDLRQILDKYAGCAREHVIRLEKCRKELGIDSFEKLCPAVTRLIEEAREAIHESANSEVRDAAIVNQVQRLIHYQIPVYGALRCYAAELGNEKVEEHFDDLLDEEKEADKELSKLALRQINRQAAAVPLLQEAI
jgi:ferritin-like metal-binding protein YciE